MSEFSFFKHCASSASDKMYEIYEFLYKCDRDTLNRRLKRIKDGTILFETNRFNRANNAELIGYLQSNSTIRFENLSTENILALLLNKEYSDNLEMRTRSSTKLRHRIVANQCQQRISEFFKVNLDVVCISVENGDRLPDYIPIMNKTEKTVEYYPIYLEVKTPQIEDFRESIVKTIYHCTEKLDNVSNFCKK